MQQVEIKKEVTIKVTSQALAILSQTKFTPEEFLEWSLKGDNGITLGGHNVCVFLEAKYRELVTDKK